MEEGVPAKATIDERDVIKEESKDSFATDKSMHKNEANSASDTISPPKSGLKSDGSNSNQRRKRGARSSLKSSGGLNYIGQGSEVSYATNQYSSISKVENVQDKNTENRKGSKSVMFNSVPVSTSEV